MENAAHLNQDLDAQKRKQMMLNYWNDVGLLCFASLGQSISCNNFHEEISACLTNGESAEGIIRNYITQYGKKEENKNSNNFYPNEVKDSTGKPVLERMLDILGGKDQYLAPVQLHATGEKMENVNQTTEGLAELERLRKTRRLANLTVEEQKQLNQMVWSYWETLGRPAFLTAIQARGAKKDTVMGYLEYDLEHVGQQYGNFTCSVFLRNLQAITEPNFESSVFPFSEVVDAEGQRVVQRLLNILDGKQTYVPGEQNAYVQQQQQPLPTTGEPLVGKRLADNSNNEMPATKFFSPKAGEAKPQTGRVFWLFRDRAHDAYMKATFPQGRSQSAEAMVKWLKEFYCERYLKHRRGGAAKARKLLDDINVLKPKEGETVREYQIRFDNQYHYGLASRLGKHRLSSNDKKLPWGLEKLQKGFGLEVKESDITAKPKLKIGFKSRRQYTEI